MKHVLNLDVYNSLPKRWGEAAEELIRIEDSGEWKEFNSSFSLYISDIAKSLKKSRSTFWRLLVAGHTYNSLRSKLDAKGKVLPPLKFIQDKPSPESLELISRIERVAPPNVLEPIQRKVMNSGISRDELRSLWGTYKQVLGGKTKRGRGVQAPRYDSRNPAMQSALSESNALALMVSQGPGWLGIDGPAYLYKVIHASARMHLSSHPLSVPDVVVLVAESEKSALQIHGVIIGPVRDLKSDRVVERYIRRSSNVDFLWIYFFEYLSPKKVSSIPDSIGILNSNRGFIEIVRRPRLIQSDGKSKEKFLRSLLMETSRN